MLLRAVVQQRLPVAASGTDTDSPVSLCLHLVVTLRHHGQLQGTLRQQRLVLYTVINKNRHYYVSYFMIVSISSFIVLFYVFLKLFDKRLSRNCHEAALFAPLSF